MSASQDYLDSLNDVQRTELERIRKLARHIVPETVDSFSYGLPGLKYKAQTLIWFGAFKDHYSIFPTAGPIAALRDQLKGLKVAKGTIQFTGEHPISDELLRQILCCRRDEIDRQQQ